MADASWLEVILTVDGELAEAVAEVLDRFASGGVVVESNVKYRNVEDEGTPYGPVKVYGYSGYRCLTWKKNDINWKKPCGT